MPPEALQGIAYTLVVTREGQRKLAAGFARSEVGNDLLMRVAVSEISDGKT
jgi:hypothetical protein